MAKRTRTRAANSRADIAFPYFPSLDLSTALRRPRGAFDLSEGQPVYSTMLQRRRSIDSSPDLQKR